MSKRENTETPSYGGNETCNRLASNRKESSAIYCNHQKVLQNNFFLPPPSVHAENVIFLLIRQVIFPQTQAWLVPGIIYSSAIASFWCAAAWSYTAVRVPTMYSERLQNCSIPAIFPNWQVQMYTSLPSRLPLYYQPHKPRIREQRLLSSRKQRDPFRSYFERSRTTISLFIFHAKSHVINIQLSNGNIKPLGMASTTTVTFLDFSREMKGPKSAGIVSSELHASSIGANLEGTWHFLPLQ